MSSPFNLSAVSKEYLRTPAYVESQKKLSNLRKKGLAPRSTVAALFLPQLKKLSNNMQKTRKNRRKNRKTRRN